MNEPILEYVKRRLNDNKGDWPKIAERTGVPYASIVNVAQGKSTNPTVSTIQPLLDYFRELDAMLERLRRGPEAEAIA